MKPAAGRVYLVGAGPGSLDLVTVRALELVRRAEVIVYDYLVNPALLDEAPDGAKIVYAGKTASAHTLTQDEINALLVREALAGRQVVRLKGGDPYVFGRGGEEGIALAREGIAFEVVPGVSSAVAAPAYAGIPVTHRNVASQVTFVTGHEDPAKPESALDWDALARSGGTKVFLMGIERLGEIAGRLIEHGASAATPAALVRWGTTARQHTLVGTLGTLPALAERERFRPPALIIVGEVVDLRRELNWFEKLPLFGQRIVVTRARRQAGALRRKLAELGADVLEIATIRIEPVALPDDQAGRFRNFGGHFDWLVFSSPNGVDRFFAGMRALALDIRILQGTRIAVLGPATAARVQERDLRVELQPETFTKEALTSAFEQVEVKGQRFCLAQGRVADPQLAERLRARGAAVETWTLYDTLPETADRAGTRERFLREGAQWIVFTSASTVENWHQLGLRPAEGAPVPRAVSIGPATSEALRRLNYDVAAEARAATLDSVIDSIRQAR